MKIVWGCNEKTKVEGYLVHYLFEGIEYRLLQCPAIFIPASVWSFYRTYNYHKEFPSAPMPAYSEVSTRFLLAYELFTKQLADFAVALQKG